VVAPRARSTPGAWRSPEDATAALKALGALPLDAAVVAKSGAYFAARRAAEVHPTVVAARSFLRASARAATPHPISSVLYRPGPIGDLQHALTYVPVRAMRAHLDAHPDAEVFLGDTVLLGAPVKAKAKAPALDEPAPF